jgi:hypothetical protein
MEYSKHASIAILSEIINLNRANKNKIESEKISPIIKKNADSIFILKRSEDMTVIK